MFVTLRYIEGSTVPLFLLHRKKKSILPKNGYFSFLERKLQKARELDAQLALMVQCWISVSDAGKKDQWRLGVTHRNMIMNIRMLTHYQVYPCKIFLHFQKKKNDHFTLEESGRPYHNQVVQVTICSTKVNAHHVIQRLWNHALICLPKIHALNLFT